MNTPQLSIAIARERGPGVHHGHVIRDQDVSLLSREPQTHSAIIQQPVDELDNLLAVVFDCDLTRGEFRLGFVPQLMPSHARGVVDVMPDDEVQILHLGVPEPVVVHLPLDCF